MKEKKISFAFQIMQTSILDARILQNHDNLCSCGLFGNLYLQSRILTLDFVVNVDKKRILKNTPP